MKILILIVACVVFVILAIIVAGSLLPKRHVVSKSAAYRTTPQALYALIVGPQDWRPDLAKWHTTQSPDGRELIEETTRGGESVTYEICDRIPDVSVSRRIATPNLPYSGTWKLTLRPQGQITELSITEDGEVYNPVFRFVSRFIIGQTRTIDAYLKSVGEAVDHRTPNRST